MQTAWRVNTDARRRCWAVAADKCRDADKGFDISRLDDDRTMLRPGFGRISSLTKAKRGGRLVRVLQQDDRVFGVNKKSYCRSVAQKTKNFTADGRNVAGLSQTDMRTIERRYIDTSNRRVK